MKNEKLKWIWKTKMNLKSENEFYHKWKRIWKMKMNLNIHTISVRYDTTLLYPQLSP
jgi:hypothetical protein